jgi:hypothetical protein
MYPLAQNFGLLIESPNSRLMPHSISLVSLDFRDKTFQKHHTIEIRSVYISALVNSFESTEFVLDISTEDQHRFQLCKVVWNKIVVGKLIELDFFCHCYFDGRLFGLILIQNGDFEEYCLRIYNIEQKTVENIEFKLPAGYRRNFVSFYLSLNYYELSVYRRI